MTNSIPTPWSWRTTASLAGLGLAIVGILLQFAGDPDLFGGFPPGIYFLVAAGVLVVLTKRWFWSPVFAVILAAWVTLGGVAGGQLGKNLAAGGLVAFGAVTLQAGLAVAIVAGIWAIAHNVRTNRLRLGTDGSGG